VNYFYPLRTTVPSGDKVLLLWDVANSDRHHGILHSPDGSRHRVDLEAGRAQVTINHSGRFRLEVVSPLGGEVWGESQLVRVSDPAPEIPGVVVEGGDIY
jgi:hypothetical protein